MDFGFPDKGSHHARGSIYYASNPSKGIKEYTTYDDDDLIRVESADGATVLSTPFLFASKRRVENVIWASQHPHVYNCSNGSKLEHTTWLHSDNFETFFSQAHADSKKTILDTLFSSEPSAITDQKIEHEVKCLESDLSVLVEKISAILHEDIDSRSSLTEACYRINNWMHADLKQNNDDFYYFIRGSIWHFLHAGFSHVHAIEAKGSRHQFIGLWKTEFLSFLAGLVEHYRGVIVKTYDLDNDFLLHRSISVTDKDPVTVQLQGLEWSFMGLVMEETGRYSAWNV